MQPEKKTKINGTLIEKFYWNRGYLTYVDNRLTAETFESACQKINDGLSDDVVYQ